MSSIADVLLQVVSVMGLAAFAVSVVLQVVTYGRARPMRPAAIVVGQAGSLLGMILFSALTRRPPDAVPWMLLLAGGCAAGIVGGQLVGVKASPQGIVMKHAVPGLLAWAAVLLFVQGSVTFAGTVPFAAYGAAIVILGVNIGMNGRVIAGALGRRTPPGAAARTAGILLLVVVPLVATSGTAVAAEAAYDEQGIYRGGFESVEDVSADLRPFIVDGGRELIPDASDRKSFGYVSVCPPGWLYAWDESQELPTFAGFTYRFTEPSEAGAYRHPNMGGGGPPFPVGTPDKPTMLYDDIVVVAYIYPDSEWAQKGLEEKLEWWRRFDLDSVDVSSVEAGVVGGADDGFTLMAHGPDVTNPVGYVLREGSVVIEVTGGSAHAVTYPYDKGVLLEGLRRGAARLTGFAEQLAGVAKQHDWGPYLLATYPPRSGGGTGETETGDGTGETETGTGTGTGTGGKTGSGGGTFPPLTPVERGTATGAAGGLMLLGALVQLLLARGAAPLGAPPSVDVQPPPTTCSRCGAPIVPGAGVCAACGLATPVEPPVPPAPTPPEPASTPPTEATSACPQCGAILPQGLAVCPACGLATSGLVPASTPSTAAPAPANAGRSGTPRIALVVAAIVTLLLLACVLGWNALGLRDDGVDTPPESTSTPPPPPSEPVVELSSGPISEPTVGSAERTALMDAARLRLGIQNKFVVQGLFVQGDRAVGILNPEGTADYHLIAWTRSGEVWTAVWNGTPDAAGKAALEQTALGLSPELIAQLGL